MEDKEHVSNLWIALGILIVLCTSLLVGWYLWHWSTSSCDYLRDNWPFSGGYAPARCIDRELKP